MIANQPYTPGTLWVGPDGQQRVRIGLQQPPIVVGLGYGLHGVRDRVEHWLLPQLYAMHIYDWSGTLRIGSQLHRIRPGDVSIIPPDTPMEYRYTGPSRHIYAHFRFDSGRRAAGSGIDREPLLADVATVQPLGREAARLRARLGSVSAAVDDARRAAEVWSVLWEIADRPGEQTRYAGEHHPAVGLAVDHIERHLADPLRVADIARIAHVSTAHLNRLFHAAYGTSVSGYLRDRRTERAEHLLRDTTQSISSVAASVGISDLQAFNKFCRSRLGAAPSRLRSAARNQGSAARNQTS